MLMNPVQLNLKVQTDLMYITPISITILYFLTFNSLSSFLITLQEQITKQLSRPPIKYI
jgi:hypothetical protein